MYNAQGKIRQRDLFDEHLPLVRRQALSLQVRLPASVELDDLIQAGMIGLLDAVNRFDAGQGASFATFASQRIRGAMLDELRSRDWVPRSVRRNTRLLDETIRRLEQQLGRPPEDREIAAALDVSLEEFHHLLMDANGSQLVALDELPEEEGDSLSAGAHATPLAELLEGRRRADLVKAIERLPEREKLLLTLYYQEDLNLKEIGAVLGVSESRVCQLHSQAVARLRAALAA
ncbi:RNA polymerase, sigma 28 (sigma F) factor [Pseudomonas sp. OF001]|jgi:RNA polymerase sigma factor for flagellar operon FliA|uniref:RNA polymerase sigma factor FliA n=1 Tax=Pseudomonas sp. OF001 TaxID=2772300 RepID=UPI00191B27BD|nr:RNA polymerase sigma factor FliA [Pseudomonas sp. OF001]CAD5379297.1 RNA polymerase, sigma 28 (sigma F) factor [Pseudomonas sp. OF001]